MTVADKTWTLKANTTGDAGVDLAGGRYTVTAYGTFGSGTLKWQRSPDGGTTWIDITDATGTANYQINIELGACKLRPHLNGSTNPNLKAAFNEIPRAR